MKYVCVAPALLVVLLAANLARATETENIGMQVLPAPGPVTVDGAIGDWDLTGGLLTCGDVESARDTVSVWVHAMYDANNLYFLARFNDSTPLNNPGVTVGDFGFQGDCFQARVIVAPNQPDEKTSHLTCWHGRDDHDLIDVGWGRKLDGGTVKDLKALGAKQAFSVDPDGQHYTQEISIPWAQLAKNGQSPGPGAELRLAIETNFTVGANGRLTNKDCFQPGMTLDRVFTFMSSDQWGTATLARQGNLAPRPVRLSDGREFAVRMEKGLPTVDWTGLIRTRERAGFKSLAVDMPSDGFASVILRAADGTVARQLLNCEFLTKGRHDVKWDGLSTPNWRQPGDPVAPGTYTASAIFHTGIGLRLKGWADNSGETPWDFPAHTGNWGGDHGTPAAVATDASQVYLGWSGAEAGKALLACDLEGKVKWNHTRGGIGGARAVAVDGNTVYALDNVTLYRVDSKTGAYTTWEGRDAPELPLTAVFPGFKESPLDRFALTAGRGKLYLSSKLADQVAEIDARTGAVVRLLPVTKPTAVSLAPNGKLYIVAGGNSVIALDEQASNPQTVLSNLAGATSVAVDGHGQIYVGCGDPDNQIKVFAADGKPVKTIGRAGGRPLLGPWSADGVRFVDCVALDAEGKLWVIENDAAPKRISVWNVESGKLVRELFGPTSYGAMGGAICPADPQVVVGQGCEWRIDPTTGRAACSGVILRDGMEISRFATSPAGRTYLFVSSNWAFNSGPLRIFERLSDGQYKLRSVVYYADEQGKELPTNAPGQPLGAKKTMVWADANDDGQRQSDELSGADGELHFTGWYLWATPDLTLYSDNKQFKCQGYTPCGAPRYNLAQPAVMPAVGLGSADGNRLLAWGEYAKDRSWFRAFDLASGKQLWQYPDTFVGVHGSHNAPPAEVGLIRGSFPPCGSVKLPEPIGNAWVIPTNVGEWHILSEHGYYLTRLFQPDPLRVEWPAAATPGANLDNVPPGMGGEDFGGSVTLARDGKLYLQAGKTAFWDVEVVGLETVKPLAVGNVTIDAADLPLAQRMREDLLQTEAVRQPLAIKKRTPKFTGKLDEDFAGATILKFQKLDDAAVRATAAWDDANLYLAWEVRDQTPWVNGATDRELMYLGGDTVDFQLGIDPAADPARGEPVLGDLRLSIGPFQGKPQAVVYRKVAQDPHPRVFSSGVVKEYRMESVVPLDQAVIFQQTFGTDHYVVEASVPLAALGLVPRSDLQLKGDFGATHGDPAGQRTRLRTFWANQHTGIVDDAVFELKMEPALWGTLLFAN
jgi:hypothetical protein